ncbi:MAG TPA: copper chaperone PCu(A)C [Methylomirabilota bacterium]|nr:copper chaperone PCu(A)C [Methylomirabilota bacterium]
MKLKNLVMAVVMTLCTLPALAQAAQSSIKVEGAWARSTPPGAKTAAAYLTVVNAGKENDTLMSASTPVAGTADVHRSFMDNGVMKMRPAGPLDLKPGASLKLAPGGYHIMMMDLKQPLAAGQTFPVTLVFKKAGNVTAVVKVQNSAPAGSSGGSMGGMNMPGMSH